MISDFLYNIFIGPIQYLVEVVFATVFELTSSKILSILGVSLIINFLVLPLYRIADGVQEKERKKQKEMEPWVKHIRKTFKGDKRYMILSTYYRQNNYNPIYALRGSFSLLLQIPFFIAAYNFLSSNGLLRGTSFWLFSDLGEPDKLIMIGSFAVNVLPILMTLINFVSGTIYTRDFPFKEKLQVYLTAVVFLVLLYNSPSGLVIYWILNNLFSLFKNIVFAIIKHIRKDKPTKVKKVKEAKVISFEAFKHKFVLDNKPNTVVMVLSCLYLAVFMGFFIPCTVVSWSPLEFYYSTYDWTDIVINTFSTYLGFMFWALLIYYMASDRIKYILTTLAFACCGVFIFNYLLFSDYEGNISEGLIYDLYPKAGALIVIGSIACTIIVGVLFYFIYRMKATVAKYVVILFLITVLVNSFFVYKDIVSVTSIGFSFHKENISTIDDKIIPLSKNGDNVIVFMTDRAVGTMLPKVLDEKPELKEKLDGFTFYPNTISFGAYTNFGTPALFGGYEYTPYKINQRSDDLLKDKQNEALLLMPAIFSNNDYKVTVCDPPYAGDYSWIPDLSMYDEYDNVSAYLTKGHVINDTHSKFSPFFQLKQYHNYIGYGLFRCLPNVFGPLIYDDGNYHGVWQSDITCTFLDSYCVLQELPNLTRIEDGSENTLLMFQNSTPHEPVSLEAPDYTLSLDVPDSKDAYKKAYDSNMASFLMICDWIDYLKANGVYDNTRIIIVADHGRYYEGEDLAFADFNPLLLVKDFGANEKFKTDNTFMTNADTPYIAMEGIIDNPVNPFTGHQMTLEDKANERILITFSGNNNVNEYKGATTFVTDTAPWATVHDDIFDRSNWSVVKDIDSFVAAK